jgi:hypothetical protein
LSSLAFLLFSDVPVRHCILRCIPW